MNLSVVFDSVLVYPLGLALVAGLVFLLSGIFLKDPFARFVGLFLLMTFFGVVGIFSLAQGGKMDRNKEVVSHLEKTDGAHLDESFDKQELKSFKEIDKLMNTDLTTAALNLQENFESKRLMKNYIEELNSVKDAVGLEIDVEEIDTSSYLFEKLKDAHVDHFFDQGEMGSFEFIDRTAGTELKESALNLQENFESERLLENYLDEFDKAKEKMK